MNVTVVGSRRAILVILLAGFGAWDAVHVVAEFVAPHAGSVDFRIYYHAAQALSHGARVYLTPPPCCYNVNAMSGYTYPPLLAILVQPMTLMSIESAGRLWMVLEWASLAGIFFVGLRCSEKPMSRDMRSWLALAFLSSGAIGAAIYGLQATPMAVFLEAVFAWTVVRNQRLVLGGLCLAFAACLKVSPILLAPAILALPRPSLQRALVGIIGGLAAGGALMLLLTNQTVFYLTRALPAFSSGVIAPWNRSLPGVILRTISSLGHAPSPLLGRAFLALEVAGLVATWFLCRRVVGAPRRILTVAGLLAIVPIVLGVTWDHHLVVELLVLMLMAPLLDRRSAAFALAVGGVVLTGINQQVADHWLTAGGLEPPHGVAQIVLFVTTASINLLGMVAIWASVVLTARRLQRAEFDNPIYLLGRRLSAVTA